MEASSRSYYVYVYRDPTRNNQPFYVGKGSGQRHLKHLKRTDRCEFVHRIQKIKQSGFLPIIEFICDRVDEEFAFLVEVEAINYYGRKDHKRGPLLNLTDGGDGVPRLSPEVQAKRIVNLKATMSTLASKERQSKAQKLSSSNPDVRTKRSVAAKIAARSPEVKSKRSAALKRVLNDPIVKQKHSAAMKLAYSKPDVRAAAAKRQKDLWSDPKVFQERCMISKSVQHRADVKAKQIAAKVKKCTVDGIIIFDSVHDLKAALGKGLKGRKHPNFAFIEG